MGLLEKLVYTSQAVNDIQKAIIEKGVPVSSQVELAHYGDKIRAIDTSAPPVVLDGTAIPGQVLEGATFYSDDPNRQETGTMAINGDIDRTLTTGEIYTIPKGYHSGNSVVRGGEGGSGSLKWYHLQNKSFAEDTVIDGKTKTEVIGHVHLDGNYMGSPISSLQTVEMIAVNLTGGPSSHLGASVTFSIGLWEKWKNFANFDIWITEGTFDLRWTAKIMDLSNRTDTLLPIQFTFENRGEDNTPQLALREFRINRITAVFQ